MAFTDLDFLAFVLEDRWQEDITGRVRSVPKPEIIVATTREHRRVNTANGDVIIVRDGGSQRIEPASLGWSQEHIDTPLSADIRTSVDRERFVGIRDDTNESERYGGLYGEVKRILHTIRKGEAEFTWASQPEWNDLSEETGYGHWRGVWDVNLKQIAANIDPEP